MLRGSYLVVLVAIVALTLYWRSRAWHSDLVGVLGSIGAFVPLLILGLAADWAGGPASEPVRTALPNQTAIVTASLGMLAWLASRRRNWGLGVAVWLSAVAGSLLTGLALLLFLLDILVRRAPWGGRPDSGERARRRDGPDSSVATAP